jgi:hypothetical protein
METATIEQIDERLRELTPAKLAMVLEFVIELAKHPLDSEAFRTMLASEAVLRRDWDTPEEDAAWAHL